MLNKVQDDNIDDDVGKLLKTRFIHESDEKYLKDALHMYAENKSAAKRNKALLSDLLGDIYTIDANG